LFLVWFVVGNYAFIPGGSVVAAPPAVGGTGAAADATLPLPAASDESAVAGSDDSTSTEVDDTAKESQPVSDTDESPADETSTPTDDAGQEQP